MQEIKFDTSNKLTFEILYVTLRKEYDRQRKLEFEVQAKTEHKVFNVHAAELYGFLQQMKEQNPINYFAAEHKYNQFFKKES